MSPEVGAEPKTAGPASVPSGTVTFLFSDIEGSTQRWEAHRDAMQVSVERHDDILRKAIETHDGYVFKTVGDAFCATFERPQDAAAAAVDAQRVLSQEDFSSIDGLRVRMGIHAGEAVERSGDYFGPEVNRVARLMSIGHGGQVLVSGAAKQMLHNALPSDTMLVDLGLRRLKDLTQPEQVWQLAIAGLPREFPPLNSLDARANNLPIQLTSLLGRERDLEEVKLLISRHRLLTLSGSGGIGKTRLALQAAADLIDLFTDGVWFADLAPISDPELVASVIASVVGMPQRGGQHLDEAIPHWLKRKQLLLILDNCEHVLETVASFADAILATAPDVRLLATSREALGMNGEQVLRLPSLGVPHDVAGLTPTAAMEFGAVALFVDRARSVDRAFALADNTAPIVAEICRRLDGIPLAIELAAARMKVLSIHNLAQRLDDRFKLLTGGSRTALPRQKTLGALIDWSYDLLNSPEQTLFTRAAVFAGGFTLGAAVAVCAGKGLDKIDILDLLSSLTDKSLVVADTAGEQERYHLLESTRAYALQKLAAAGESERMGRRHAEHFRYDAQAADVRWGTESTATWLASMQLELDNFRAVLGWALTDGHDLELGGAVAGALEPLWFNGGLPVEGRYWIARAQAGLDESAYPDVAARLWRALSRISVGKGRFDCAQRALGLHESLGDAHGAARALASLSLGLFQMGRVDESSESNARALAALREIGNKRAVANCLSQQAMISTHRGDVAAGRDVFAQALDAFKSLGDEDGTARVLANLAELEFEDRQVERALRLADEALEIDARGKNALHSSIDFENIAVYRVALGDLDGARQAAREGLRWARQAQHAFSIAVALQHFAMLGALREQTYDAALLLGYVNKQYNEFGSKRESTEKWGYDKLMAALREQLSDTEIEKLAAEGAAWSEDQAIEEALKL